MNAKPIWKGNEVKATPTCTTGMYSKIVFDIDVVVVGPALRALVIEGVQVLAKDSTAQDVSI